MGNRVEKWQQPDTKNSVGGSGIQKTLAQGERLHKAPIPPYSKDEIQ